MILFQAFTKQALRFIMRNLHEPDKVLRLSLIVCVTILLNVLPFERTWPNTYRCKDSLGQTVFTDSPAQLDQCEQLSNDSPPSPPPAFSQPPTPRFSTSPHTSEPEGEQPEKKDDEEKFKIEEKGNSEKEELKTVTVPLRRYGGSLIVPVNLNNERNVHLILDTGATMTVLSTDIAIELGLTSDPESQVATVNTAGGPVQVNLTKVKLMGINGAKAQDVVVAIHDLPDVQPGIDGLLGMSFLNNFLVTLDSNQGQLHLRQRP